MWRPGHLPCCLSLTGISGRFGMCCITVLPAVRRLRARLMKENREVYVETLMVKAGSIADGYAKMGNKTAQATYEGVSKDVTAGTE